VLVEGQGVAAIERCIVVGSVRRIDVAEPFLEQDSPWALQYLEQEQRNPRGLHIWSKYRFHGWLAT